MARFRTIDRNQATGKELLDTVHSQFGMTSNLMRDLAKLTSGTWRLAVGSMEKL